MSTEFSSDEYKFGELGVIFEARRGWRWNGKKACHYILCLRDVWDEGNVLTVSMTPEDAKRLAGAIFDHSVFVEGWEAGDRDFHPEDYEDDEGEDDERCSEGISAIAPTP